MYIIYFNIKIIPNPLILFYCASTFIESHDLLKCIYNFINYVRHL